MISIRKEPLLSEYGSELSSVAQPSDILHSEVDSENRRCILGHYPAKKYFYLRIGKEIKGVLLYRQFSKDVVDFYETLVTQSERGKGLGKLLAKAGMEFVVEKDLKVKLSCTFMQKFVDDACLPIYFDKVFISY